MRGRWGLGRFFWGVLLGVFLVLGVSGEVFGFTPNVTILNADTSGELFLGGEKQFAFRFKVHAVSEDIRVRTVTVNAEDDLELPVDAFFGNSNLTGIKVARLYQSDTEVFNADTAAVLKTVAVFSASSNIVFSNVNFDLDEGVSTNFFVALDVGEEMDIENFPEFRLFIPEQGLSFKDQDSVSTGVVADAFPLVPGSRFLLPYVGFFHDDPVTGLATETQYFPSETADMLRFKVKSLNGDTALHTIVVSNNGTMGFSDSGVGVREARLYTYTIANSDANNFATPVLLDTVTVVGDPDPNIVTFDISGEGVNREVDEDDTRHFLVRYDFSSDVPDPVVIVTASAQVTSILGDTTGPSTAVESIVAANMPFAAASDNLAFFGPTRGLVNLSNGMVTGDAQMIFGLDDQLTFQLQIGAQEGDLVSLNAFALTSDTPIFGADQEVVLVKLFQSVDDVFDGDPQIATVSVFASQSEVAFSFDDISLADGTSTNFFVTFDVSDNIVLSDFDPVFLSISANDIGVKNVYQEVATSAAFPDVAVEVPFHGFYRGLAAEGQATANLYFPDDVVPMIRFEIRSSGTRTNIQEIVLENTGPVEFSEDDGDITAISVVALSDGGEEIGAVTFNDMLALAPDDGRVTLNVSANAFIGVSENAVRLFEIRYTLSDVAPLELSTANLTIVTINGNLSSTPSVSFGLSQVTFAASVDEILNFATTVGEISLSEEFVDGDVNLFIGREDQVVFRVFVSANALGEPLDLESISISSNVDVFRAPGTEHGIEGARLYLSDDDAFDGGDVLMSTLTLDDLNDADGILFDEFEPEVPTISAAGYHLFVLFDVTSNTALEDFEAFTLSIPTGGISVRDRNDSVTGNLAVFPAVVDQIEIDPLGFTYLAVEGQADQAFYEPGAVVRMFQFDVFAGGESVELQTLQIENSHQAPALDGGELGFVETAQKTNGVEAVAIWRLSPEAIVATLNVDFGVNTAGDVITFDLEAIAGEDVRTIAAGTTESYEVRYVFADEEPPGNVLYAYSRIMSMNGEIIVDLASEILPITGELPIEAESDFRARIQASQGFLTVEDPFVDGDVGLFVGGVNQPVFRVKIGAEDGPLTFNGFKLEALDAITAAKRDIFGEVNGIERVRVFRSEDDEFVLADETLVYEALAFSQTDEIDIVFAGNQQPGPEVLGKNVSFNYFVTFHVDSNVDLLGFEDFKLHIPAGQLDVLDSFDVATSNLLNFPTAFGDRPNIGMQGLAVDEDSVTGLSSEATLDPGDSEDMLSMDLVAIGASANVTSIVIQNTGSAPFVPSENGTGVFEVELLVDEVSVDTYSIGATGNTLTIDLSGEDDATTRLLVPDDPSDDPLPREYSFKYTFGTGEPSSLVSANLIVNSVVADVHGAGDIDESLGAIGTPTQALTLDLGFIGPPVGAPVLGDPAPGDIPLTPGAEDVEVFRFSVTAEGGAISVQGFKLKSSVDLFGLRDNGIVQATVYHSNDNVFPGGDSDVDIGDISTFLEGAQESDVQLVGFQSVLGDDLIEFVFDSSVAIASGEEEFFFVTFDAGDDLDPENIDSFVLTIPGGGITVLDALGNAAAPVGPGGAGQPFPVGEALKNVVVPGFTLQGGSVQGLVDEDFFEPEASAGMISFALESFVTASVLTEIVIDNDGSAAFVSDGSDTPGVQQIDVKIGGETPQEFPVNLSNVAFSPSRAILDLSGVVSADRDIAAGGVETVQITYHFSSGEPSGLVSAQLEVQSISAVTNGTGAALSLGNVPFSADVNHIAFIGSATPFIVSSNVENYDIAVPGTFVPAMFFTIQKGVASEFDNITQISIDNNSDEGASITYGPADTQIQSVAVYRDNGDGQWDFDDELISLPLSGGGEASVFEFSTTVTSGDDHAIPIKRQDLVASGDVTGLFVVYGYGKNVSVTSLAGIQLTEFRYNDDGGLDNVLNGDELLENVKLGFDIASTINMEAGPSIVINDLTPIPGDPLILPGSSQKPVYHFNLKAQAGQFTFNQLTLRNDIGNFNLPGEDVSDNVVAGTGKGVIRTQLWESDDSTFDVGEDTLLDTIQNGSFSLAEGSLFGDTGVVTFTGFSRDIDTNESLNYFITYDVGATTDIFENIGSEVAARVAIGDVLGLNVSDQTIGNAETRPTTPNAVFPVTGFTFDQDEFTLLYDEDTFYAPNTVDAPMLRFSLSAVNSGVNVNVIRILNEGSVQFRKNENSGEGVLRAKLYLDDGDEVFDSGDTLLVDLDTAGDVSSSVSEAVLNLKNSNSVVLIPEGESRDFIVVYDFGTGTGTANARLVAGVGEVEDEEFDLSGNLPAGADPNLAVLIEGTIISLLSSEPFGPSTHVLEGQRDVSVLKLSIASSTNVTGVVVAVKNDIGTFDKFGGGVERVKFYKDDDGDNILDDDDILLGQTTTFSSTEASIRGVFIEASNDGKTYFVAYDIGQAAVGENFNAQITGISVSGNSDAIISGSFQNADLELVGINEHHLALDTFSGTEIDIEGISNDTIGLDSPTFTVHIRVFNQLVASVNVVKVRPRFYLSGVRGDDVSSEYSVLPIVHPSTIANTGSKVGLYSFAVNPGSVETEGSVVVDAFIEYQVKNTGDLGQPGFEIQDEYYDGKTETSVVVRYQNASGEDDWVAVDGSPSLKSFDVTKVFRPTGLDLPNYVDAAGLRYQRNFDSVVFKNGQAVPPSTLDLSTEFIIPFADGGSFIDPGSIAVELNGVAYQNASEIGDALSYEYDSGDGVLSLSSMGSEDGQIVLSVKSPEGFVLPNAVFKFDISSDESVRVSNFLFYPNPFTPSDIDRGKPLEFGFNLSGRNVRVRMYMFDSTGRRIAVYRPGGLFNTAGGVASPHNVVIDMSSKAFLNGYALPVGVYIAKLVATDENGAQSVAVTKLAVF